MNDRFFIGRERELQRVEQVLLRDNASTHNPRLCHVWGESGVGKSALMGRFAAMLPEENDIVVWFGPEDAMERASSREFFSSLIRSGDTSGGDFIPFLNELKTKNHQADAGNSQSQDFFWSEQLTSMITGGREHGLPQMKPVKLLFLIDGIAASSGEVRGSFCTFINRLVNRVGDEAQVGVLMTGRTEINQIPDIFGYWDHALSGATEIKLENLSREDTFRLLDAQDLDPNLIQKIYIQTQGHPRGIVEALSDQGLQNRNTEEWFNRGRSFLQRFNDIQSRWLRWAAVVKNCNDESLALMTQGRELHECLNWIRSSYPAHFSREGSDYILSQENRRAILAYLQQTEPVFYNESSEKLQQYHAVRHAIPTMEHRKLLSLLSELHFFNIPLIKRVFDEPTANAIINLIESKPVFFRIYDKNMRMASGIRASIALYNNLFKTEDRARIKSKIANLWQERQTEIDRDLTAKERLLHEREDKNRSLGVSLHKLDEEIERFKSMQTNKQQTRTEITSKHGSYWGTIGGLSLQLLGIILLYINILVLMHFSVSYLGLAIACIVGGFFVGGKKTTRTMVVANHAGNAAHAEQRERILQQLNLDRITMLNQKEQIRNQIEGEKANILTLQNELRQSYVPEH